MGKRKYFSCGMAMAVTAVVMWIGTAGCFAGQMEQETALSLEEAQASVDDFFQSDYAYISKVYRSDSPDGEEVEEVCYKGALIAEPYRHHRQVTDQDWLGMTEEYWETKNGKTTYSFGLKMSDGDEVLWQTVDDPDDRVPYMSHDQLENPLVYQGDEQLNGTVVSVYTSTASVSDYQEGIPYTVNLEYRIRQADRKVVGVTVDYRNAAKALLIQDLMTEGVSMEEAEKKADDIYENDQAFLEENPVYLEMRKTITEISYPEEGVEIKVPEGLNLEE